MSVASLKLVLRKDKINGLQVCPIYLRITKFRKVGYISTGVKINVTHWDEMANKVKKTHPNSVRMNQLLQNLLSKYTDETLISENDDMSVNVKKIKDKISGRSEHLFFEIADEVINRYKVNNSFGTYAKTQSIVKKLNTYVKGTSLKFNDIDVRFIHQYEAYLRGALKNGTNTVSKDLKFLRTVFNYAINQDLIESNLNPFHKYKIHSEGTTRVFLTIQEIELLKEYDGTYLMNLCRDIVLFQYYSGGIRISDALVLRMGNVQDGRLSLVIRKTGVQLSHILMDSALKIIAKYSNGKGKDDNVFGFLPNGFDYQDAESLDRCISGSTALINKNIKIIAKRVGVNKDISTHSFRHSFAINALKKGMKIEQIQMVLKHSNIRETMIYAKIASEDVDNALLKFDE